MQIIFLDESGQPGGFDKENKKLVNNTSRYFTLAGFMIEADKMLEMEKDVRDVKIKYDLNKEHEIKWHTTYSKLGLDFEQYKNMKLEVIKTIGKYKESVIGIVMDKESCYQNKDYINTPNDLYSIALHLLMERCCIKNKSKKKDIIPMMMIADSRQSINSNKLDKELKIAYLRAKNMGTHFMKFPNFCESIIFVDSNDFSGVQLADFCAGAIHKKYESEEEEFLNALLPAIVTRKDSVYGAGIKLYK